MRQGDLRANSASLNPANLVPGLSQTPLKLKSNNVSNFGVGVDNINDNSWLYVQS